MTIRPSIALAIAAAILPVAIRSQPVDSAGQQTEEDKILAEEYRTMHHGQPAPSPYETAIINLKSRIRQYQSILNRERRAAQISGYVDKATMHSAGLVITQCEDQIERQYELYRAHGGRKPLAAIRVPPGYQYRPSPFDY